ncbi:MAG: ATP-binding protein [Rhodocyclaceae bacterium]|nr:ATP-binding protein [Rhodocyclaceae bacterium]
MSLRKRLPIGISTFREIREEGHYYVDKTPFVARLAEGGKYYFLSRPRRFGKSLFLDTLAEAFAGNRALFEGLYLEKHWDWDKRYPVIRISFAGGVLRSREELDDALIVQLSENARRLGVTCERSDHVAHCLSQLIVDAAEKHGQRAVVLVDEYDKPILDNLEAPQIAREMREGLKNAYSVLKARDAELKFVFLTGVSKFSKVSIFSGLNNLYDITLEKDFAAICGYTDEDVDTVFAPELEGLDREEIRRWYDGYRWDGPAMYNPFDLLLLFKSREFRAHWFETGTPTFLVNWLKARQFFTPQLERLYSTEALLSAFDVEAIEPEAMLWQTGYLTIRNKLDRGGMIGFELGLPNREVRSALNEALLGAWYPERRGLTAASFELYDLIAAGDVAGLRGHFERLYAAIPHDWYRANPIAQYEGYYASVFYSHLAALGLSITAEDVTNQGRIDLAIRQGSRVWVIEFKLVEGEAPTGEALAQLKAKDYAAKYRAPGVEVIELGIEFSATKRNIVGWQTA